MLQALTALLADDNKFGFIIMDGNGALFGTLSGNTRDVLHKFTVDLPKKHGGCHRYRYNHVSIVVISSEFGLFGHNAVDRKYTPGSEI